jgi:GxxExxY protein
VEHKELTEKIISCSYQVYNKLGSGFVESVYHRSMAIELSKRGIEIELQKAIAVFYEGELVGEFMADIIVEKKVVVELKAVKQLAKAHEVQLVNYLVATGIPVGLLINFGEDKVEVRRKLKTLK